MIFRTNDNILLFSSEERIANLTDLFVKVTPIFSTSRTKSPRLRDSVMKLEEEFTLRVPEGVKIDEKILRNDWYLEEYENRDVEISYTDVDAFLDPSTFYNTLLTLDTEMGIEPDTSV